jgi:ADP-ribose pyrophosphatase YjhB (NUDIX family)
MSAANLSGDRVADRLGVLEKAYGSFPVNQTTLSVSADAYEQARERCSEGFADVYVQVYDETDNVLLVERGNGWTVPRVEPRVDDRLETGTRRNLVERTGVECRLTDLKRATILGVRDECDPDRDPVYRLVAVFAAEHTGGSPGDGAAWHAGLPESTLPGH